MIPRDRPALAGRARFDFAGAVTVTAAMLLLVRTVVEAPDAGWGSRDDDRLVRARRPRCSAAFVAIERRTRRIRWCGSASCARARSCAPTSARATLFGSYFGFQFVATLYLQTMLGWSAIETALAFLPAGLLVAFGSPRARAAGRPLRHRAADRRWAPRRFVAGYVLFLRLDDSPTLRRR